jgi:hypothetical protein
MCWGIDFRDFCFWGRYRFNNGDVYDGMFAGDYVLLMCCDANVLLMCTTACLRVSMCVSEGKHKWRKRIVGNKSEYQPVSLSLFK